MNEEIQDKLEEIYKFPIEVKFKNTGFFEIFCKLKKDEFILPVLYDKRQTLESNIHNIVMKIDSEIMKIYKEVK